MARIRLLLPLFAAVVLATGCATPCADVDGLCLLAEELPEAFMSVRARADDDVWLVGSEVEPDVSGPSAVWWDGEDWNRIDTSEFAGHELWWSFPTEQQVTMVGTGGLILEYDRASEALTRVDGPPEGVIFFGVWGATGDDVWAVGGDVENGALPPQLWHRDADGWTAWQDPFLPEGVPGELYYKVHGTSASDVWIVGNRGISLRFDGTHLSQLPTDTDLDTASLMLLTVDARGEHPIAVGGLGAPAMLHWDGLDWRDHSPEFGAGATGICRADDRMVSVGQQGTVYRWSGSAWSSEVDETLTFMDYHACDLSPGGDLWAVGGQLTSRPLNQGVVLYEGTNPIKALD
jgi:hypothetical protein